MSKAQHTWARSVRRQNAAYKACEGISTEELVDTGVVAKKHHDEVVKELWEALKGLKWMAEPYFSNEVQMEELKYCDSVLAKYKGE